MNRSIKDLEFKVYTSDFSKSEEDGRRLIRGYASVSDVLDRQNEVVAHEALVNAAKDLMESKTVFYEHKHDELPIGKVVSSTVDENGLMVVVEISKGVHADNIWTLIKEDILNSFSIGGRVKEGHSDRDSEGNSYNIIDKLELFEVSVVGLPANAEARFKLVKSFNLAITKQIKEKEGRVKMAKQVTQEVNKSDESTLEVAKVDETKVDEVSKDAKVDVTDAKDTLEDKVEDDKSEKSEVAETPAAAAIDTSVVLENKEAPVEEVEKTQETSLDTEEVKEKKEDSVAEKSTDEKILDSLSLILVQLTELNKKEDEVTEKAVEEKVVVETEESAEIKEDKADKSLEENKEDKIEEDSSIDQTEEVSIEKKVEEKTEDAVEKVIEDKEEAPARKSIGIVVPSPYEEEGNISNDPKVAERQKNLVWSKLVFGK